MIRKLLFASMLTICCIINSMAQQPVDTMYLGNTTILSELWSQPYPTPGNFLDSIGGPVQSCGLDGRQLVLPYSTAGNSWWPGGGAWQINGAAYYPPGNSHIRDYSQHSHMKLSYFWNGTDPNNNTALQLSFTDSTAWSDTAHYTDPVTFAVYQQTSPQYTTGPTVSFPGSDGSGGCITVLIPLSAFVGSYTDSVNDYSPGHNGAKVWLPQNINLANLQVLNFGFSGADGSTLLDGNFYVDDILILDLKPVINSLSSTSGQAGDVISIFGGNFMDNDGNITIVDVTFDGNGTSAASYTVINAGQIDVTVPAGFTDGTISVYTSVPTISGTDYLQATSSQLFTAGVAGISAKNASLKVSVAPNPSTGIFNINSQDKIDEIIVSDQLGNVILNSSNTSIDLSNQPVGLYFLTIISGDKKSVQKLAKQ